MTCTRCGGTGFLNIEQVPDYVLIQYDKSRDTSIVLSWMNHNDSDVQVCDCCGDGDDWYGGPGEHFVDGDHAGPGGPYAYNGGLPECN